MNGIDIERYTDATRIVVYDEDYDILDESLFWTMDCNTWTVLFINCLVDEFKSKYNVNNVLIIPMGRSF